MIREICFEIIKYKSQKKNYVVMVGHLIFLGLCYLGFKTSKLHFICFIVARLPFAVDLKPYLRSNVMNGGAGIWLSDIPWYRIGKNISILALCILGFSALAICTFNLKDIK